MSETNNTLAEALKPFAAKAEQFSKQGDGLVTIQMDFAHFRRASEALATLRASTDAATVAGEDQIEVAALAVANEFYGPDFDPFQNPEGYAMAETAARAAIAALHPAPAEPVDHPTAVLLLRQYHDAEDARNDCDECENEGPWEQCGACSGRIGPIVAAQINFLARADMRAFGASDAACHLYPGAGQEAERAAFIEGAAYAFAPAEPVGLREARIQLGDEICRSLCERGHASCGQEAVRIAALSTLTRTDEAQS